MYKLILFIVLILTIQSFKIGKRRKPKVTLQPNNYPIRAAYIDRTPYWYGDNIAKGWAVPGYAAPHDYNYILLAFWSCAGAPKDMAGIWSNARTYFDQDNSFGSTTGEIQKALRKIYNDNGIKILVSAFGDSEFPTSAGSDAVACGKALG